MRVWLAAALLLGVGSTFAACGGGATDSADPVQTGDAVTDAPAEAEAVADIQEGSSGDVEVTDEPGPTDAGVDLPPPPLCAPPIPVATAADLIALLPEMMPVGGQSPYGPLPITGDLVVSQTMDVASKDVPASSYCPNCRGAGFVVAAPGAEGLDLSGSPPLQFAATVRLSPGTYRMRPIILIVNGIALVKYPLVIVMPACTAPCQDEARRCPHDRVCYEGDAPLTGAGLWCPACLSGQVAECVCLSTVGPLPDGTQCSVPHADMMGGGMCIHGACSGGSCESLPANWKRMVDGNRDCREAADCVLVGGTGGCAIGPALGAPGGDAISSVAAPLAAVLMNELGSMGCADYLEKVLNVKVFVAGGAPATNLRCEGGKCIADPATCTGGDDVPDALPDVPDVDEDASGPDADVMADACTPACTDKTCGDDGCGGTCGACPDGMECDGTACVANACPPGFARVPSGTFTMGSPPGQPARNVDETLHDVTLTRSFCLAETEVSQDEWKVLLGTNPAWFSSCANCPVERVSWWDAVAYCNALSAKEGLPPCYDVTGCTGSPGGGCPPGATDCLGAYSCLDVAFAGLSCRGYRLPTEAEWEYAAKAGAAADTADGASDPTAPWNCEIPHPALDPVAWFCGNSQWATHGVKGKNTNAWGLYDMLGNVREWCWDSYGAYPAGPVTDPVGPTAGAGRVQRGGRFSDRAANVRAANRYHLAPGITGYTVGLRVARTLP